MGLGVSFFVNSTLLGVGLAMDAFSVSLANGLSEPCMSKRRQAGIPAVFALFQTLMPLAGWALVSTAAELFSLFEKSIPYIALILLCFIGGKMLLDGLGKQESECPSAALSLSAVLLQGVATSIDALSVGFTVSDYSLYKAALSSAIIGGVTFLLCLAGVFIGRHAGTRLAGRAGVLGGIILIAIGIEIFIKGIL